MASRVSAPIAAPQPSMTAGLATTVFTLVIIAVTKSTSRSRRRGIAITVIEYRTVDRNAPIRLPIARKTAPSRVEKTAATRLSSELKLW